jgi:hypothetical protein
MLPFSMYDIKLYAFCWETLKSLFELRAENFSLLHLRLMAFQTDPVGWKF